MKLRSVIFWPHLIAAVSAGVVILLAHTGEVLGIPGQTIAGIASAGGVVLVWTGFALAWRRFRAWVDRRNRSESPRVQTAA